MASLSGTFSAMQLSWGRAGGRKYHFQQPHDKKIGEKKNTSPSLVTFNHAKLLANREKYHSQLLLLLLKRCRSDEAHFSLIEQIGVS